MSEPTINDANQPIKSNGEQSGAYVYFPRVISDLYSLSDTTAQLKVTIEDGSPVFKLSDLPTGFSESELLKHAQANSWEHTDSYQGTRPNSDEEEWYHTFRTEEVRVVVDNTYVINGGICSNISIEGEPEQVKSTTAYEKSRQTIDDIAEEFDEWVDVYLSVHDSGNYIENSELDFEVPPATESVQTLLAKDVDVTVTPKAQLQSVLHTLEDVDEAIAAVSQATEHLSSSEA